MNPARPEQCLVIALATAILMRFPEKANLSGGFVIYIAAHENLAHAYPVRHHEFVFVFLVKLFEIGIGDGLSVLFHNVFAQFGD